MTTIDWTRPIETVDGEAAELARTLNNLHEPNRLVIYKSGDGEERCAVVYDDGRPYPGSSVWLRNVPAPRRKVTVRIHKADLQATVFADQAQTARCTCDPTFYTFHEIEIDG
jgi:hypothetical protein